jgi:hypothetical protein
MKLEYFEGQRPRSSKYGICSDELCPCNENALSPGNGYLYISEELVEFRKDALTLQETEQKVLAYTKKYSSKGKRVILHNNFYIPILMCRQGATRRGIDMEIAGADAEYFWETGLVPLRPTPQSVLKKSATPLEAKSSERDFVVSSQSQSPQRFQETFQTASKTQVPPLRKDEASHKLANRPFLYLSLGLGIFFGVLAFSTGNVILFLGSVIFVMIIFVFLVKNKK